MPPTKPPPLLPRRRPSLLLRYTIDDSEEARPARCSTVSASNADAVAVSVAPPPKSSAAEPTASSSHRRSSAELFVQIAAEPSSPIEDVKRFSFGVLLRAAAQMSPASIRISVAVVGSPSCT